MLLAQLKDPCWVSSGLWRGDHSTPATPAAALGSLCVRGGAGRRPRAKGILSHLWPGEGLRLAFDGHLHPSSLDQKLVQ